MKTLLLVEDTPDDQFIMQRALTRAGIANPLQIVEDGEQAIEYINGTGRFQDRAEFPLPVLIFLDLKLPLKSGLEVLGWLRNNPELSQIVVVVLTSSDHPSDINNSYRAGANSYLVKPPTAEGLVDLAKAFKWYWLEFNRFGTGATAA